MLFRNGGALLMLIASVASVWLWLTGQLNLYIHPRYIIFTFALAVIAIGMIVVGAPYDDEEHDEVIEERRPRAKVYTLGAVLTVGVCVIGALTLMLVKPATLTSSAANQRGINTASVASDTTVQPVVTSPLFAGDNYSNLSIKDWAGLLAQTSDITFFVGKQVSLTGFVTADQNDPKNVFYVSRFAVTCCVVDARPLGVAVYEPGWQSSFRADSWVEVKGKFVVNPSAANPELVAVEATAIKNIKQPDDPYAY